MTQFKVSGAGETAGHGASGDTWLSGEPLYLMLGLVVLTMGIIWLITRVTKVIPAPLAGIGIVAAVVIGFGLDVPRVGDLASIEGGLPLFHIPLVLLTLDTLEIILPYASFWLQLG